MNRFYKKLLWPILAFLLFQPTLIQAEGNPSKTSSVEEVGIYRLFETQITNSKKYGNPFTEVTLEVQFQAPSGRLIEFWGFFDGDGQGGAEGNIWKIRFLPEETGTWTYVYRWSDGSEGGKGTFECTPENAGKGILQPYNQNPHWLAYNGTDPVWLKSYYETGHGSLGQDFDWIKENVYQPLIDHGYNHLQVNWLLSLCCFKQYYLDGPEPETLDLALYKEGKPFSTMNMEVWHRMEQHLGWLNTQDVGVHMFLGVDGSQNEGPAWEKLTPEQKDQFVKYMVARLAPFANLAGWNFVWEVPGDRESHELGFARLVQKYDVFDHLRTYEDEFPRENEYQRNEYSFAAVENHQIAAPDKDQERHLWRSAWTHHMACLLGYEGKPVFMSEGNALWRRFWHERVGADQDDLRRGAWACATAGASFTWNGHAKEYELYAGGPSGLPFNDQNPFQTSEKYIQILAKVMQDKVDFYQMKPHDELLAHHQVLRVYALAQPGQQYVVFAPGGESFSLQLEKGAYSKITWIDSKSGEEITGSQVQAGENPVNFQAPNQETDWVLVVKK
ncbi:DUF5060 domain-containing protein [Echinicola jeungdonensis]|uniref:DUF5060 domain-containing protein n=1 Tax=Echinicola jeungdonensis TaxID=709343 RepID=A0ABV5J5Q1_9BACT|nr:DUF5060 domain-containing protein [Echinicola jeungdonensis]MDN3669329.1 DUF5060 domain-containing protein [Echinicola jeungdonensis]